uniref:Tetraspanin 32 n=1 Tax=Latimeria chalumnae TaxID=7897 RepID=H3AD26_LATCH
CVCLSFCEGVSMNVCIAHVLLFQIESAVMDAYDFLYEQVRGNMSISSKDNLIALHNTFSCCGKKLAFSHSRRIGEQSCDSENSSGLNRDCLQVMENFLKKHIDVISVLMLITAVSMVYGMVVTSFLGFSFHLNNDCGKKGKYVLTS